MQKNPRNRPSCADLLNNPIVRRNASKFLNT
jgi:hypothetical protein